MRSDPLQILSPKHFSKHRVLNDWFEMPTGERSIPQGSFIWCKIDKESKLSKVNSSGMKVYNVWVVTDNFKKVVLTSIESAKLNLSEPSIKNARYKA
jgi:hypothetical protein